MELKTIDALIQDLKMVKGKISSCDARLSQATEVEARKLEEARVYLEAVRDRLACALDLVTGRAFTIKDNGNLAVFEPDPKLAKLLKAAEEMGARIIQERRRYEQGEK